MKIITMEFKDKQKHFNFINVTKVKFDLNYVDKMKEINCCQFVMYRHYWNFFNPINFKVFFYNTSKLMK